MKKTGAGSIVEKNGKFLWVGYYKDEYGKIKRPTRSFDRYEDAVKFQAEQTNKTIIRKEMKSEDITLNRVFEIWLSETDVKQSSKKSISANYKTHIKPLIGENRIKKLSVVKFEDYLKSLVYSGKSEKTAYNIFSDLRTIINYALEKGIIYENPLKDIKPPKQIKPPETVNVLSMEDYEKIILNEKNQKSYFYEHILFLGETGLRESELAITDEDIKIIQHGNTEIWTCYISKTIKRVLSDDGEKTKLKEIDEVKSNNSKRKIFLNGFAIAAIKKQKEKGIRSKYIFCNKKGEMIEYRNLLRTFHKFCENAGIKKLGLHSLRKCYINRCLIQGIKPFDLAKQTGHSIQTMFKYYHDVEIETGLQIIDASEIR